MSYRDALLTVMEQEATIENTLETIEDRLTQHGAIQIDPDPVNDNGGFTAVCERTDREAGVFVSMTDPPLVTIAVNLSDARPLIVRECASRVTLGIRDPTLDRIHRISCTRAESARDDTPLLMFETRLSLFTQQREDLCILLIAALFRLPV